MWNRVQARSRVAQRTYRRSSLPLCAAARAEVWLTRVLRGPGLPAFAGCIALAACGGEPVARVDTQYVASGASAPSSAGTTAASVPTAPGAAVTAAGTAAPVVPATTSQVSPTVPSAGAASVAASAGSSAAPVAGAPGHSMHGATAGAGSADAAALCALKAPADPRDAMLTSEPQIIKVGSQQDTLVPQIVLDWMDEHQFAESHDGWHLVRKWDQTCRKSNATTCAAAERLVKQGLSRAPIQQGAPGDGLAFMMMHRHMIVMLKSAFPKNAALFNGFVKIPKAKADAENPQPWRDIRWSSNNLRGFEILENIEQHLDQFPTEDDLGQYIENTYRWTAQSPTSPVNAPGSGLHGALHAQWSVSGSPGALIEQAVDVKNYVFWKLHGWIDDVWERYRKAKGLKDDDPAYQKLLVEQCMEMHALQPRNRKMPNGGNNPTTQPTVPETGTFATTVRPFLDSSCGGCHSAIAPSAGMTLGGKGISSAEIIAGLVGVKATNGEYNLIEPGAPQKSWVYLKASGEAATVACSGACDRETMPPSGMGLTAAQLTSLRSWIMSGATDK